MATKLVSSNIPTKYEGWLGGEVFAYGLIGKQCLPEPWISAWMVSSLMCDGKMSMCIF
jgi:hypothetical protein